MLWWLPEFQEVPLWPFHGNKHLSFLPWHHSYYQWPEVCLSPMLWLGLVIIMIECNICQICCTSDNYKYKTRLCYIVCISVYGKSSSFFNISCCKLDFAITSVQPDLCSFIPSSFLWYLTRSFPLCTMHCILLKSRHSRLFVYTFVLAYGMAVVNIKSFLWLGRG